MAPKQIRVPIPEDLSREFLLEYFSNLMEVMPQDHEYEGDEDTGKLANALDLDIGDREEIEGIEIEEVEVSPDGVFVSFALEISAYLGCSDLNYNNVEHRTVRGITDGNEWVFDIFLSPPARSTHEEF